MEIIDFKDSSAEQSIVPLEGGRNTVGSQYSWKSSLLSDNQLESDFSNHFKKLTGPEAGGVTLWILRHTFVKHSRISPETGFCYIYNKGYYIETSTQNLESVIYGILKSLKPIVMKKVVTLVQQQLELQRYYDFSSKNH